MGTAQVYIENEQDKLSFCDGMYDLIERVVNTVLKQENFKYDCEVSVMITDNEEIRLLNHEHRGKDTATDVLSFPMLEFDENGEITNFESDIEDETMLLGDIVISLERAASQAEEYGHSLEREVGFLSAHSTLHLLGYDHDNGEEERKIMREKEEKALNVIGLTR